MQAQGTVFIVDDDADVRQSWECVLAAVDMPVRSYPSAERFLEEADRTQPCCLILDLRMPGMGGVKLLETLRLDDSTMPIFVISGHADVPAVIQSMKMGLVDFLTKPVDPAILLDRIRCALRDVIAARSRKSEEDAAKARIATLSDRELEVFRLLVRGRLHKQIAQDLGISTRTVDHHHALITMKMKTDSLAELVRLGLLADVT